MRPFGSSSGRLLFAKVIPSPVTFPRSLISYHSMASMRPLAKAAREDYTKWTKEALIKQLIRAEAELKRRPASTSQPHNNGLEEASASQPVPPKRKGGVDPSRHSTRYIALKLAYLGRNYSGFEFSASGAQPSIEEELYRALAKTCLIFPENPDVFGLNSPACEYSKCGRTDRGVSAFGQVIGLRVRSSKPVPGLKPRPKKKKTTTTATEEVKVQATEMELDTPEEAKEQDGAAAEEREEQLPPWDPIRDELAYTKLLNRVLPPDIRILAWCPSPPPDFSARFSCHERQYRYFFTQPAFTPPSSTLTSAPASNSGWLDLDAMRDAASRFVGEHDFSNFCKVDPTKMMTSFTRRIHEADILPATDMSSSLPFLQQQGPESRGGGGGGDSAQAQPLLPEVYYFKVRGTAFLWHQIRHMVSILFLVGQGLEPPSIVDELLDTAHNPRRPVYTMADEVPLVLWNCSFRGDGPDGELPWIYAADDESRDPQKVSSGPIDDGWRLWRERKMDEILANGLLRTVAAGGPAVGILPADEDSAISKQTTANSENPQKNKKKNKSVSQPPLHSIKLFEGGDQARPNGKYIPVMQMRTIESPAEVNEKYAKRKGFASVEEMRRDKVLKWEQAGKVTRTMEEE